MKFYEFFFYIIFSLFFLDFFAATRIVTSGNVSDELFVKYVEENRILWDTRCSDYKDVKEKGK